jgi:hypothetical protein
VEFVDVYAERGSERLYSEAKGGTAAMCLLGYARAFQASRHPIELT